MLGDKNLDSEEYSILSTGVYPPIFHSFRKKRNFIFIYNIIISVLEAIKEILFDNK